MLSLEYLHDPGRVGLSRMHARAEDDVRSFVGVGGGKKVVGIDVARDRQQGYFIAAQSLAKRLTAVVNRFRVDRLFRLWLSKEYTP